MAGFQVASYPSVNTAGVSGVAHSLYHTHQRFMNRTKFFTIEVYHLKKTFTGLSSGLKKGKCCSAFINVDSLDI